MLYKSTAKLSWEALEEKKNIKEKEEKKLEFFSGLKISKYATFPLKDTCCLLL